MGHKPAQVQNLCFLCCCIFVFVILHFCFCIFLYFGVWRCVYEVSQHTRTPLFWGMYLRTHACAIVLKPVLRQRKSSSSISITGVTLLYKCIITTCFEVRYLFWPQQNAMQSTTCTRSQLSPVVSLFNSIKWIIFLLAKLLLGKVLVMDAWNEQ